MRLLNKYGVGVFTKRLIKTRGNEIPFRGEDAKPGEAEWIVHRAWDALTNDKKERVSRL
jgi:hypothetical protein